MGGCCSYCNKNQDAMDEEEDSEEAFQERALNPEPGPAPPDPDNPAIPPNHISVYNTTDNPLDGKEEFVENELSPLSDSNDI